jgi:hypothetical protein
MNAYAILYWHIQDVFDLLFYSRQVHIFFSQHRPFADIYRARPVFTLHGVSDKAAPCQ